MAQAHDFIAKLSRGYKTRIGRHFAESEQLSGGQWQKIALSRVFYRDAKLIVLDEPTSSLDPNAEFKVFENLKNNLNDQVIIVVTHRLYNLKIADHIYVLKDGKISQEGNFETLINADGEFRTMYNNQKL
jgi:ATP-binding cassette subfamily B protein